MSFARIYAIFVRQWFLVKSNPTRLVGIFIWILLDIFQWGFISKYIGSFGQTTMNFVLVILGAIILWDFTYRIAHGLMTAFLEDVWSQNFINFFASPLKIGEYLMGLILSAIATTLMGLATMLILAGIVFGYNIFSVGLMLFPFIGILFLFGLAMGIFIVSIIFRLGSAAEWIGWPIPFLISIFTGVYYPISTLPIAFQTVSRAIPASYVFESMRQIVATGGFSANIKENLLISFGLAIAYLLLAYWVFIRVYQYNLKTGHITRFNTEDL